MVIDKLINEIEFGLKILFSPSSSKRPRPDKKILNKQDLNPEVKKKHAQLMRVNHSGEICAQALYRGQAMVCKDAEVKAHLVQAGEEETDHLIWCKKRLEDLNGKPSILNPVWYAGSFAIGAIFGSLGEKTSLGFVEETEKQVVKHLEKHLDKVSKNDVETIEILKTMRADEDEHAQEASENGGESLSEPTKKIMSLTAKVMTSSSAYI